MGERWDRIRSAVQRTADRVSDRVKERAEDSTFAKIRKVASELGQRKARVPLSVVRRVLLTVPGVEAASLAVIEGGDAAALGVDLELENGRRVRAEIRPEASQFAPRGAKELSFRVTPVESAAEPVLRELVGALASLVARTLWSASLPPSEEGHESGLIDREGEVLRIDLRTIPAVRAAIARGPAVATLLDVITPEAIVVEAEGLVIRIGLPKLGP